MMRCFGAVLLALLAGGSAGAQSELKLFDAQIGRAHV